VPRISPWGSSIHFHPGLFKRTLCPIQFMLDKGLEGGGKLYLLNGLVYSEELYVELSPRSIAFHKDSGYGQPPAPSLFAIRSWIHAGALRRGFGAGTCGRVSGPREFAATPLFENGDRRNHPCLFKEISLAQGWSSLG